MRIYLDFDDTLVARMTFFRDYYTPILLASGSTQREIDVSYSYFAKNGELFSPARHLEILGWREQKKEEALLEIENIIREQRGFIFPEVVEVLKKLRADGHTLILFTYGDRDFQKQKITASAIAHLFDEMIITHEDKVEVLARDREGEPILFVDDKVDFLSRTREILPEVYTVHMCRVETGIAECEGHSCSAHLEITHLTELAQLLKDV